MDLNTEIVWSMVIVYSVTGLIILVVCWLMLDDDDLEKEFLDACFDVEAERVTDNRQHHGDDCQSVGECATRN